LKRLLCQPKGWSVSLAFAPIKCKPKPSTNKASNITAITAFSQVSMISALPLTTISATAIIAASPTLIAAGPTLASGPVSSYKSGWGKKVKPPSMVLDNDVNGY
jgi:splicing factor 45